MSLALDMVAAYLKAEQDVLQGLEVKFNDRMMRMVDLPEIRAGRAEWERRAAAENAAQAGTPTFGGVTFSVATFNNS